MLKLSFSRHLQVRGVAGLLAFLPLSSPSAETSGADIKSKPNVVIILADDQGFGDIGFQPHDAFIRTPNIERLAQRGIYFTQGYASSEMCTPSRAGLLSGRYPGALGMYDVGDALIGFPPGQKIMPQYFKELGYATGIVGKWHLGGELEDFNYPLNKGFDRFWGFVDSTHDYWKADTGSSLIYGSRAYSPIYDQRTPVPKIDYLTRDITKEATAFIRDNKDHPFFLYVAYNAAHVPLQAPKEVFDRYANTPYGDKAKTTRAMMEVLDDGVGKILDTLKELKLDDKTIVIYSSDNGGGEPDSQINGDLRGGKFTFWEGGIRVPTVVSWPGKLPGNKVYTDPIVNLDFLPTLMAAVGGTPEKDIDGVNLLPYLRGEKDGKPHDVLHWSLATARKDFAIRDGDWKLVRTGGGCGLYNLKDDPRELHDLSKEKPKIAEKLWQEHLQWIPQNRPTLSTPEEKARAKAKAAAEPKKSSDSYNYSSTFGGDR